MNSAALFDRTVAVHRRDIVRFIASQIRDRETAEDLVQDCLRYGYQYWQAGKIQPGKAKAFLMECARSRIRRHLRDISSTKATALATISFDALRTPTGELVDVSDVTHDPLTRFVACAEAEERQARIDAYHAAQDASKNRPRRAYTKRQTPAGEPAPVCTHGCKVKPTIRVQPVVTRTERTEKKTVRVLPVVMPQTLVTRQQKAAATRERKRRDRWRAIVDAKLVQREADLARYREDYAALLANDTRLREHGSEAHYCRYRAWNEGRSWCHLDIMEAQGIDLYAC